MHTQKLQYRGGERRVVAENMILPTTTSTKKGTCLNGQQTPEIHTLALPEATDIKIGTHCRLA